MGQRKVKGSWTFQQNTGHLVNMNINFQEGDGKFGGFATESDKVGEVIDAKVSGDDIVFTIKWNHGPVGVCVGRFDHNDRMSGFNFDQTNPQSQSTWVVINRTFNERMP